jgi:predicted Zn finger-like uncharacterized protein
MKIACPSCQLTGNINELELPPTGRNVTCPRCKNGFHVAKPNDTQGGSAPRLPTCPSCQYSTFTEETFAVCPKCGMSVEQSQILVRNQRERERTLRDQDTLNRSFRNPDLVKAPVEAEAPEPVRAVRAVEVTAWFCMALGGLLFCYGVTGLVNYYQKDWQAILSEPVLVPVSKLFVFFSLGFVPWVVALFSLYFVTAAYRFWKLQAGSLQQLTQSAWAGIGVVLTYETLAFINWVRVSSSTPSIAFYGVGVLSSLFLSALLGAPFFLLLCYLKGQTIKREFNKARVLSQELRKAA